MPLMITGGAGVVGTQLCRHLRARGHEVVAVDVMETQGVVRADLLDDVASKRVFETHRPEVVLHLAANKNVFFCEENPDVAHAVNFQMTESLVGLCAAFNARMIFISSDYVFGEEDRVWKEDDTPCPTTQYGRDKAASEKVIGEVLSDYAIVRTSGLYGFQEDLVHVVRSVLAKGETFNAFDNLSNCPTFLPDLFNMLDAILQNELSGVFHCVGPEAMSRFDYAKTVAEVLGLDASLVQPESVDFEQDIRPPSLRLSGAQTYSRLGVVPRKLSDNLRKTDHE